MGMWNYLDGQVQREYTKIGQRLEQRKVRPELVGLLGDAIALGGFYATPFIEAYANLDALRSRTKFNQSQAVKPMRWVIDTMAKAFRLPFFAASGLLLSSGIAYLATGFSQRDYGQISEGMDILAGSLQCLGITSSMYFRDRDTRLLKRDPLWKDVTDYLTEKLSLQPQPQTAKISLESEV